MTRSRPAHHLAGLVAAVLTAAAGLVGLSSAPAAAAQCSGKGVNVVVDFNGLGGGVQKGCDPNGANRSADKVFPAAGFQLTYAQRQPGFVCRVNGTPKSDPCVNTSPADAYWGLFWSDGKSGTWHYASTSVGGLKVPDGGFVAFSWQGSQSKSPPSATPRNSQPAPTPKPTKTPTPTPTKKPGPGSGGQGGTKPSKAATATATKAATASPAQSRSPKPSTSASPTASASASASTAPSTTPTATDDATPQAAASRQVSSSVDPQDEQGGLPTWVPVVVIVGLAGGAGGAIWWRRRAGAA